MPIFATRPPTDSAAATSTDSAAAPNGGAATSATTSPTGTGPTGSTAPAVAPAGGAGSLTANGTSLLPIAAATTGETTGDLSKYVGQPAAAQDVMVLSAPADNGFWVGTSTTDEVYAHLLQPGLVSPHPVRAGDHVSFTGAVVANSATLAADDGVDAAGCSRHRRQRRRD